MWLPSLQLAHSVRWWIRNESFVKRLETQSWSGNIDRHSFAKEPHANKTWESWITFACWFAVIDLQILTKREFVWREVYCGQLYLESSTGEFYRREFYWRVLPEGVLLESVRLWEESSVEEPLDEKLLLEHFLSESAWSCSSVWYISPYIRRMLANYSFRLLTASIRSPYPTVCCSYRPCLWTA